MILIFFLLMVPTLYQWVADVSSFFPMKVHEAVARVASEQFKEGIVIQEVRRGFFLGKKVLRPAMVKVSSGSGVKNPSSTPIVKQDEKSVPPTESN